MFSTIKEYLFLISFMFASYLIVFREFLEASLIVSIVLNYLDRTERTYLKKYVWVGVVFSIVLGATTAAILWSFYGGLSTAGAKLFEGVAALLAVVVLTTMILWMSQKGKTLKDELHKKTEQAVNTKTRFGLIGFAFIVVFREVVETILFLIPFVVISFSQTLFGALLGVLTSLIITFLVYNLGKSIKLQNFFFFSSVLLILLAAGLLGYGVHELLEYFEIIGIGVGQLGEYAFHFNVPSENIFHHKGVVGSALAVMFGYSTKMEWARLIAHAAYLLLFLPLVLNMYTSKKKK